MNKNEKIICFVLVAVLVGYLFFGSSKEQNRAASAGKPVPAESSETVNSNSVAATSATSSVVTASAPAVPVAEKTVEKPVEPVKPSTPEVTVTVSNAHISLELSSWGAAVKKAVLKEYARGRGEIGNGNPPLEFDFSAGKLGELYDERFSGDGTVFQLIESSPTHAVFTNRFVTRTITLKDDYQVVFKDVFSQPSDSVGNKMSVGVMTMGAGENDQLSVDSWQMDSDGGEVVHHCEDGPLKPYLVSGFGGCSGCSGSSGGAFNDVNPLEYNGFQKWIALKNRFFVTALVSSSEENNGFSAVVYKNNKSKEYRPEAVSAAVRFGSVPAERETVFYVGPKKQSLLWDLGGGEGMREVMEFGMWSWICYPIVYLLNLFHGLIPNYGVAIILLTVLIRLIFWPLTRKSTLGMRKMQEIQPKLKEIQKQFKDNPQRLQQEIWMLYRTEKVNPLSSCLPMLIQIPVFIALFNVLRTTVELRYAPFLWIPDLSEPEGLFKEVLPFGGLNILPILMALTMAVQSALTPSTGDASQKKMMVVFMPLMMLVMFYSFPAALSLYWTLSQVMSIVQMWMIRRSTAKKTDGAEPEIIDPPQTRQMRRHG